VQRSLPSLLYLALLLAGCSDITIIGPDNDDDDTAADDDDDSAVVSDDDDSAVVPTALSITPEEFNFGARPLNCSSEVVLQISNIGDQHIEITGMNYESSAGLSASPFPPTPFQLPSGTSTETTVTYLPLSAQQDVGTLSVESDAGSATATQVGVTLPPVAAADEFLQQGNRTVDILWMIDSSCSMAAEQEALGDNFGSFLDVVDQLNLDYRIGVITADLDDLGSLHGAPPYVTPTTGNAAQVFAANVVVGQTGSGAEQGFDSIRRALVEGAAGDFLRGTAQLRVISVSDEDDQSMALGSVSDYIAELQSLKPNPSHVIHSDISGGATGCASPHANADPAPRYLEATNLTGGISTSICEAGWVQTLTDLAWLSDSYADTFALSQPAIASSVNVLIDGLEITAGWSWDSALNAVIFDADTVPQDGSLIRFEYSVTQPCSD